MPERARAKTIMETETAVEDLLGATEAPDQLVTVPPKFVPPVADAALPPIFQLADTLWFGARQFIPKAFKNPAEVVAAILTGRELGLGAMTSLRTLHPVNGKIEMSAELMLALVNRGGVRHEWLKSDKTEARLRLTRDGYKPFEFAFTIEDAKEAKLYPGKGKSAWRKYPRTMLRWRCVSAAISAYCPDLLLGVYVDGELDNFGAPMPASWRTVQRGDAVDAEYEEEDDDEDEVVGKKKTTDDDMQ